MKLPPSPSKFRKPETSVAPPLVDILRALPPRELTALAGRLNAKIDPQKRIDAASQVARVLLVSPELRNVRMLPQASAELLHRIAENHGTMLTPHLPPGLEALLAKGIVFARQEHNAIMLILPAATLLQLRTWGGEDPRSIRALLSECSVEVQNAIASHYLGRPATPPVSLAIEQAWQHLGDPRALEGELDRLAEAEMRVLQAVLFEGGEVYTEELLELEREPLRLRTASGATPSRRGVGFSLERRALLIPVHPNRHVVPTEVARILGAVRNEERERSREALRHTIRGEDHAPTRASFSAPGAPLAVAMALASREHPHEVRPGVGTPKAYIQRMATRFGKSQAHVALLVALARAVGVWDVGAMNIASSPGSLSLGELSSSMYNTWKKGGAWDEARPDSETLRLAHEARDTSPVSVLREVLLDALRELGDDRWIPWTSIAAYIAADARLPGLTRLLRRWAERTGVTPQTTEETARRIALESLPALGIIDLSDHTGEGQAATDDNEGAVPSSLTLRVTAFGRAMLNDKPPPLPAEHSHFLDSRVLRLVSSVHIADIWAVAQFVEIGQVAAHLDLLLPPQALARAISAGFESDTLRMRIEKLAKLPDNLSSMLIAASVVVGRGAFVPSSGFLWIEDTNVREMLRTRKSTGELFADPSPPAGLLVQDGVDFDKLVRRCRSLGVEIEINGAVARAKAAPPTTRLTPAAGIRRESEAALPRVSGTHPTHRATPKTVSSSAIPAVHLSETTKRTDVGASTTAAASEPRIDDAAAPSNAPRRTRSTRS